MEEINLVLSKNLFHGLGKEYTYPLNIAFKQHTKWKNRNNIINTNTHGVYAVFDAYSGDFHTPNNSKLFTKQQCCIYVGEGDIRTRLNTHSNTGRFGDLAEEVVFYIVEDQLERKLLERILIYHYKPLLNKEKGLYDGPKEKIDIIKIMNENRNSILRKIETLKSFLEIHNPSFQAMNVEEIFEQMLSVSSIDLVADDLRRKAEILDRLRDIKSFWDDDLPQYREKTTEEILSKLLSDAPIEYVEEDVLAAWLMYMGPSA